VPELVIRERPPSMLRNTNGGPPGGTEAEDPERPPSTLRNVNRGAPGGCWRQVRQRPPPKLKTSIAGPRGGDEAGDPGAPTTNAKKSRRWASGSCRSCQRKETSTTGHREVPELVIRERPPLTLTNIDDRPPGGAGAGDPGASTINAKKLRRWAPGRCRSW
jgi:hypothetical protein